MAEDADLVEQAVRNVLESGLRTGDIMQPGMTEVSCTRMGEAVTEELDKLAG
jgi:3-isopropylmalate dehydrogenase